MIPNALLRNLTSAENRLITYQKQMSGVKISKSSDDPVGIENVMQLRNSLLNVENWKSNADEAITIMDTTDSMLNELNTVLQQARDLTVYGANTGAVTPQDREKIAMEIDQLAEHVRLIANTKVTNRYIFGGTRSDHLPLEEGDDTWQGNNESICYQIGASNNNLPISVNGVAVFSEEYTQNSQGFPTADIFQTLKALSTIMKAADPYDTAVQDEVKDLLGLTGSTEPVTISGMLDHLDGHIDNGLSIRADLGARRNRMESISEHLETMSYNLTTNLANVQDADLAETITYFQNQQNIYKAALSIGAQMIEPSLVDFMR
jgi:flagellar hook-associated protein 3 FlgL